VELDAMAPATLRTIVEFWINKHLPADRLRVLQEAEKSEREILKSWVGEARR
jgi:hypothetical protein